jgi:hypothetical protein
MAAWNEWVMGLRHMSNDEYERRYFKHFDPDLYDSKLWADAAAKAGMRYFVITTKHHECFCLWDSALTDYKAPAAPNCRRDLLTPMVDAFRARSMRVGLYHSLLDWHYPDYIVDTKNHPLRSAADLEDLNRNRDQMRYADYLHGQVRELLTNFGRIDILWLGGLAAELVAGGDAVVELCSLLPVLGDRAGHWATLELSRIGWCDEGMGGNGVFHGEGRTDGVRLELLCLPLQTYSILAFSGRCVTAYL